MATLAKNGVRIQCYWLSYLELTLVVKLSTKYKTIGHRPLYKILRNKYIRRKFSPTDSTFVFSSNFQFCTLDWQGKVLIRSILIKKDQWWLRTMFEAALKPPVIINRITTFFFVLLTVSFPCGSVSVEDQKN